MQQVLHKGNWNFDYIPNKLSYAINDDTLNTNHFVYDDKYLSNDMLSPDFRKAATIHKLVRQKAKAMMVENAKYFTIVTDIEKLIITFTKSNDSVAFPIGLSINNIAAHDSALVDDTRVLHIGDVVKCDFGVQINGCIIDSAFTHIVGETDDTIKSHKLYPLLEASADATYSGICASGPDARLYEISEVIKEVIESYEVDEKKLKAVNGLGGHDILPYEVHGQKLVLSVPHKSQLNVKMDEDDIFAIETYASTGSGNLVQLPLKNCTHFGINQRYKTKVRNPTTNIVVDWVTNYRHKLPFVTRWLSDNGVYNIDQHINKGLKEGTIMAFPPLVDTQTDSFVSQLEHTIRIKPNGTEIYSLGKDY